MLLTISTTHQPATDLGFVLMKNPGKVHSFELSFGNAHVFYPEASVERCTACLLLDVDSVALVRGKGDSQDRAMEHYVNDRPYVASSFLSVAIARVFGTCLSGKSKERQELAESVIPLEVRIPVLPCRGGDVFLKKLFEPLGYEVEATQQVLDEHFVEWGASSYWSLTLRGSQKVRDLLSHLYVLIPVLDDEKHYYVDEAEVQKLLKHGEGWLAKHPAKEVISLRYLSHKRSLSRLALAQLVVEEVSDPEELDAVRNSQEEEVERPISLNEQRMTAVLEALKQCGARRVIDLGCGEGRLLKTLLEHREFEQITGVDVSPAVLEKAYDRLRLERMPDKKRARIELIQGSLVYRDDRLKGFDAATCIEVIEHMDPPRLPAFERTVFETARPGVVIVTTPNVEYNKKFEKLPAGKLRHGDHRFEWTRAEFESWCREIAERYGYSVKFSPIGPVDEELGAPTQMGVFTCEDHSA